MTKTPREKCSDCSETGDTYAQLKSHGRGEWSWGAAVCRAQSSVPFIPAGICMCCSLEFCPSQRFIAVSSWAVPEP